jgi:hypothetical protein
LAGLIAGIRSIKAIMSNGKVATIEIKIVLIIGILLMNEA